jgi:ribose transport system substrate-binding protein
MRLAVFTKNSTNPAYAAARLGAERAAAALGASVEHYVPETPDNPEQQSRLIDAALAGRPDAFVLSPVHATRVDPAIRRIADAGIPMVGFVNPIEAARSVSYVGADDARLARDIAAHLFRHLDGRGRVLVVTGPDHSFTSRDRLRGFLDAAGRYPGIRIAGQVAGDYDRSLAKARAAAWLRENGCPDACLVANDSMAMGVLETLDATSCRAVVVGVNAIPEAITAIAQGRMLATVDFSAMQMAFIAAECAIRHLRGEAVPAEIALPVQIVDRGNCRDWDLPYAQRPLLTLDQLGILG